MGSQVLQTGVDPILLIYGPTASGKSALAVDLAHLLGGEVINTDSMQVYQEIPVLTAQPDTAERDGVTHHLYGHMNIEQHGSVAIWLDDVLDIIARVQQKGKTPILAGGTGLYFEALTRGLAKVPKIGASAIAEAAEVLQSKGSAGLREAVAQVDPAAAARIQGADHQRLLRALSVYLETGCSLSTYQKNTSPELAPGTWRGMVLRPEREKLYARIEARFDAMLNAGALDEARAMNRRDLPTNLPAMKALGLQPLMRHIAGQMTRDEAVEVSVRDTRRYAKRQYTWASGRFAHWPALDAGTRDTQKNTAMQIAQGPAIGFALDDAQ